MKYGIIGFIVITLVIVLGMIALNHVGQNQILNIGNNAIEQSKQKQK